MIACFSRQEAIFRSTNGLGLSRKSGSGSVVGFEVPWGPKANTRSRSRPGPSRGPGPYQDLVRPKPYKFIGVGDIHGPKPCKFRGFGDIHGPKTYKFIGFAAA